MADELETISTEMYDEAYGWAFEQVDKEKLWDVENYVLQALKAVKETEPTLTGDDLKAAVAEKMAGYGYQVEEKK